MALLLWAHLGCQEYGFAVGSGKPEGQENTGESGANDSTDVDDTQSDSGDSGSACEAIEVAPAQAWGGATTCTPFEMGSWDMVIRSDFPHWMDPLRSVVANPVVGPVPGYGSQALYQCEDGGLASVDAITGVEAFYIPRAQNDANGVAVAADHGEGSAWIGIASLPTDEDGDEAGQLSVAPGDDVSALAWSALHPPYLAPGVTDLDADGYPDFVLNGSVVDRFADDVAEWSADSISHYSTVVDLDGDGRLEMIGGDGIASTAPGAPFVEWSGLSGLDWTMFQGAAIKAGGEILIAGTDRYVVFVAGVDGVVRWSVPYQGSWSVTDLIALGDATGDGVPEICAIIDQRLTLFDVSGTVLWAAPPNPLDAGGCAMADLDADGTYEVIQWGTGGLQIRAGANGRVLASREDIHTSFTWNGPVIADVDGDGGAEIVVSGAYNTDDWYTQNRLFVLGPAKGRWARTRPVWNQWAYDVTSVRDDGTIVSFPFPPWATYNAFRAQPAHDGAYPDLVIAATDACATTCGDAGLIRIAVQVSNVGSVEAPAGAVVRLLTWPDTSGLREFDSAVIAEAIPPGMSAAGVELEVPVWALGTRRVLEVVGSGSDECDWVNNREEIDIPDPCAAE